MSEKTKPKDDEKMPCVSKPQQTEEVATSSTAKTQEMTSADLSESLQTLTGKDKKAFKKKLYAQQHPEPQASQRKILKDIYIDVKDPQEKKELFTIACFEIFANSENPFTGFLDLYSKLHDVSVPKTNTLAGLYVQQFSTWFAKQPDNEEMSQKYLTTEVQEFAMKTLTLHHSLHINKVAEAFSLKQKCTLNLVMNQIQNLIRLQKFKEAMDMASQFDLKENYPFESFLLPRILQDAFPDVKEYCKRHLPLQRSLIQFFDNLIYKEDFQIASSLRQYCQDRDINQHAVDKITAKSVSKNIKDLLLTYNLEKSDKEYAPTYWWCSRHKSLLYTVKRRFCNHDNRYPALDHPSYVSSVKGYLAGTDNMRKEQFLQMLWNSGDEEQRHDAIAWITIFDMPRWDILPDIVAFIDSNPTITEKIRNDVMCGPQKENISNLKVEETPIVIVNSWDGLLILIELLKKAEIIGIDSEWKPQYLAKVDEVAVLQIAMKGCIYLVDFVILEDKLDSEQWSLFFSALLKSQGIKLGFDFINDLRAMFHNSATREFKDLELNNNNCICIKMLMENILEIDPQFVDLNDSSSEKNADDSFEKIVSFKLSTLCEKFLGVTIDKTQQCSDWANRPLTVKQIIYAALDAHILLNLYSQIKQLAVEKQLDFEDLIKKSLSNSSKKERTKAKKAGRKKFDEMTWREIVEKVNDNTMEAQRTSKRAQDFKCVVDLMLLGLGKHLRRCGADVYIPASVQELTRIAQRDRNRLILTSGKSSEALRQLFPNRVMIVTSANNLDPLHQLKYVLHRAQIELNKEDIFIRCKECNHVGFLCVPAPVIQALHQCTVICANIYHDEPFDVERFKRELSQIIPDDYGGYGCSVCLSDPSNYTPSNNNDDTSDKKDMPTEDWFHVNVHQGRIDILRNLVIHENTDTYVTTQVKNIPENVIRPGRLFYICPQCGKIFYEGHQQDNYLAKIAELLPPTSANSVSRTSSSTTDC